MPVPKAELVGNALQDAKTGVDKNGKPYCLVKIACSDSHKDEQNNQWITDRELFVNVRWFGANPSMRIPQKGDRVITFGKLSQSTDTGQDGTVYTNFNCDAEFIKSFEKRPPQGGFGGQQGQGTATFNPVQAQNTGNGWGQQSQGGFGQQQAPDNDPWNSAPPSGSGGFGGGGVNDDSEPPF